MSFKALMKKRTVQELSIFMALNNKKSTYRIQKSHLKCCFEISSTFVLGTILNTKNYTKKYELYTNA